VEEDEDAPVTETPVVEEKEVIETPAAAPAPAIAAPSVPAEPAKKKLTDAEWLEIESHYEYGTMTVSEIMAKWGITNQAISQHIKRALDRGRTIKKGSKRHLLAAKTAAAVTAGVATGVAAAVVAESFESKRKARIERSKERLYNQSEAVQAMAMQIQKEIIESKGAIKPSDREADIKTLYRLEALIEKSAANRWKILDIDATVDESALPTLIFEDLSAAEIIEMQARSGGEDDDEDDMNLDLDDEVVVTTP
jgi:hypothetical protein